MYKFCDQAYYLNGVPKPILERRAMQEALLQKITPIRMDQWRLDEWDVLRDHLMDDSYEPTDFIGIFHADLDRCVLQIAWGVHIETVMGGLPPHTWHVITVRVDDNIVLREQVYANLKGTFD